jgi:hypothetical protein
MLSLAGFVENIPSSTRRRHTLPSVDQKPSTEKQRMTKLTKEILSKEKHSNIRNTLDKECGHTFPSVVSGCPLTLKSHITSSPSTNSPPRSRRHYPNHVGTRIAGPTRRFHSAVIVDLSRNIVCFVIAARSALPHYVPSTSPKF